MMLRNLVIGVPVMLLCLVVQTSFAFWSLRYYVRNAEPSMSESGTIGAIRPLLMALLVMMLGTFVQITVWGVLFLALGEFDGIYEATYHSAVNFSSLGYGDFVMSAERKMLGPLEAVCGVLMLGMSAATLMAILQHMIRIQLDAAK